ncbi:NAD(P)H-hydrate epimerase [Demequina aurantiaca]|uniref:NAD(P)H-hydrate epimerase n=1 Tax=Demequina aurantiaca TaxID=676200 RepID=UPI000785F48D|nr:NAD(P)H-hydrate epimerase [Demequina aurantiaca]
MATYSEVMTAAQLRDAERITMQSTPEAELMDRAADAVAAEARGTTEARTRQMGRAHVVVLAGTGNNGGDALLAGALLSAEGADAVAVLVGDGAHERGLKRFAAAGGRIVRAADSLDEALALVREAHCVIDGIVGLGARAGLRAPADGLVAEIPLHAAVIAVDIPSGLEADSGDADLPHVHAGVTVTFTALKRCLSARPAKTSAGLVVLADVGVTLD